MLKNLLVHVPSERLIRPVVEVAVSLAASRAAHLDAVSVGYETANVGIPIDAGGAAVAAVFEIEQERALARANAALAQASGPPVRASVQSRVFDLVGPARNCDGIRRVIYLRLEERVNAGIAGIRRRRVIPFDHDLMPLLRRQKWQF